MNQKGRKLDPIGAVLSITGLVALLYAIIEAPQNGWTDTTIMAAFVVGAVLLVGFSIDFVCDNFCGDGHEEMEGALVVAG